LSKPPNGHFLKTCAIHEKALRHRSDATEYS